MFGPANACSGGVMNLEFTVGLFLSALLLGYLGYALLRPERF